jgi:putative tryptophan/tyrosine transport system substrate-binding protein
MRRREVLAGLCAAAAWPLSARAQPKPMPVVGILDPDVTFIFDAFDEGMRDLGYVEGRNIAHVRKVLHGNYAVLPALAAELVDQKVGVVVTVSPPLIRAVERASNSIPIVVLATPDPVRAGFVNSFAHPGGNITGLSFVDEELAAKRLDLLRALVPNLREVAVFWWGSPNGQGLTAAGKAGQALGLQLHLWELGNVDAFEPAFREAAAAKMDGTYALAHPFFNANRERFAELAAKYRLPAVYESADYVRSGCLMGYGPVFTDMGRRGAYFVDRILKGDKPGDLPFEVTTKFELSINLKAAAALGLAVPPTLLAEATEVIE